MTVEHFLFFENRFFEEVYFLLKREAMTRMLENN
jgi:hypothetical protein